jgi:hypothetical protein
MIKKLIKLLEDKALSPNAFFILAKDVFNYQVRIESECSLGECLIHLQEHKFIKITDVDELKYELRQKGIDFIKQVEKEFKNQEINIEIKTKPEVLEKIDKKTVTNIHEWIEEYRDLFKGLKPGSKGDKGACLNRMTRFFVQYPEFASKHIILKATEKYINEEARQNYKYLQRADYFIFKLAGKEEISRLASFCDEVDDTVVEGMTEML